MKNPFLLVLFSSTLIIILSFQNNQFPSLENFKFNRQEIDSIQSVKNHIDSFLNKPFDLVKFHKKHSGNSSGFSKKDSEFPFNKKGIYYQFYYPMHQTYIIKGDTFQEKFSWGWDFQITAFHPEGKHMHLSQNPKALLMDYCSTGNVPAIPELAFIGQKKQEIINKLGKPKRDLDSVMVYSSKNNVLCLSLVKKINIVKGVKYQKLNINLDTVKTIPQHYFNTENCHGG